MLERSPPRALHDPALCFAPGLFKSLIRGSRNVEWIIPYEHGKHDRFVFSGEGLLGCDDLRILQGLVALANRASLAIRDDSTPAAKELRDRLELAGDVDRNKTLLLATSRAAIARAAGYGTRGGTLAHHVKACLDRLAAVEVDYKRGNRHARVAPDRLGRRRIGPRQGQDRAQSAPRIRCQGRPAIHVDRHARGTAARRRSRASASSKALRADQRGRRRRRPHRDVARLPGLGV